MIVFLSTITFLLLLDIYSTLCYNNYYELKHEQYLVKVKYLIVFHKNKLEAITAYLEDLKKLKNVNTNKVLKSKLKHKLLIIKYKNKLDQPSKKRKMIIVQLYDLLYNFIRNR